MSFAVVQKIAWQKKKKKSSKMAARGKKAVLSMKEVFVLVSNTHKHSFEKVHLFVNEASKW